MKASALAISMILILVPLAGCAGSDGEVNVDLTTEEIQELIDDNIDDFLNNTTVTVNQENHNNNTTNSQTIVNHNNYTTIESPSSLKSKSGSMEGVKSSNSYAIGVALIVAESAFSESSHSSVAALDGVKICVSTGSLLEDEVLQWYWENNAAFTAVNVESESEAIEKIKSGECEAVAFSNIEKANQRKEILDTEDNSGNSLSAGTWISFFDYGGLVGELSHVGNGISIIIEQSSEESISLISAIVIIDLIGTCKDANNSECSNFSFQTNNKNTGSNGGEVMIEISSMCSHGVSHSWSTTTNDFWNAQGLLLPELEGGFFPGLDCVYTLNFELVFGMEDFSNYGYESYHDLSWGDWVYSIVWESTPIEQEN